MLERYGIPDHLLPGFLGAAPPPALLGRLRGVEEQPRGLWRAEFEVEGAVGADGDAAGHGSSDVDVGCPGVEFL